MVDCYQNGARTQGSGAPIFDLNQALPNVEDEEEEQHQKEPSGPLSKQQNEVAEWHQKQPSGPAWLHSVPQKTWQRLNEPVQNVHLRPQQWAVDENLTLLPMEHHYLNQSVAPRPFFLRAEQQTLEQRTSSPQLAEHHFFRETPSPRAFGTKRHDNVTGLWSSDPSAITQDFLVLHEKQNQYKSGEFGTFWDRNEVESSHVMKCLSPVSPPARRKSLSPVSPEHRPVKEDLEVAVSRANTSEGQASPSHGTILTRHHSEGDVPSRRRHRQDSSLTPRDDYKRRREHSPSTSPVRRPGRSGRSRSRTPSGRGHRYSRSPSTCPLRRPGRGGRSRSRTPPARGHRYSPRSRHNSPHARYSSRRRSSPVSYQPKRRPWSPPPNRDTGLGKPGRNLFIAGFSFGTRERDLERKFSRYGRVRDVRIVRDRQSGESRGFGFVTMDRDEYADAAVRDLDQTEWNGRIVLVEKAKDS